MPKLVALSPFFIVADMKASLDFYVSKLGFQIWHLSPENFPFFAMVGRDNVSVMLKTISAEVKPAPNHTLHEWARWDAYIYSEDPDALFEEYKLACVTFRQSITDDDDGLRGFEVMDADGYILFFGKPKG